MALGNMSQLNSKYSTRTAQKGVHVTKSTDNKINRYSGSSGVKLDSSRRRGWTSAVSYKNSTVFKELQNFRFMMNTNSFPVGAYNTGNNWQMSSAISQLNDFYNSFGGFDWDSSTFSGSKAYDTARVITEAGTTALNLADALYRIWHTDSTTTNTSNNTSSAGNAGAAGNTKTGDQAGSVTGGNKSGSTQSTGTGSGTPSIVTPSQLSSSGINTNVSTHISALQTAINSGNSGDLRIALGDANTALINMQGQTATLKEAATKAGEYTSMYTKLEGEFQNKANGAKTTLGTAETKLSAEQTNLDKRKKDLTNAIEAKNEAETTFASAYTENVVAQKQLQDASTEVTNATTAYNNAEGALTSANVNVTTAETNVNNLQSQYNNAPEEQKATIGAELNDAKQQLVQAKTKQAEAEAKFEEAKKQKEKAEQRLEDAKAKAATAQKNLETATKIVGEKRAQELTSTEAVTTAQTNLENQTEAVDAQQKYVDNITATKDAYSDAAKQWKAEKENAVSAANQFAEHMKNLKALEKEIKTATKKLEEFEKKEAKEAKKDDKADQKDTDKNNNAAGADGEFDAKEAARLASGVSAIAGRGGDEKTQLTGRISDSEYCAKLAKGETVDGAQTKEVNGQTYHIGTNPDTGRTFYYRGSTLVNKEAYENDSDSAFASSIQLTQYGNIQAGEGKNPETGHTVYSINGQKKEQDVYMRTLKEALGNNNLDVNDITFIKNIGTTSARADNEFTTSSGTYKSYTNTKTGNTFYFKDGKNITKSEYDEAMKAQAGGAGTN